MTEIGTFSPPSLYSLAKAACFKAAPDLTDVGDVPYELVRDILKAITNPEQLREIELNSPQMRNEDAELWQAFILRDFPMDLRTKKYKPRDKSGWYEVYQRYKTEHSAKLASDQEHLKNSMDFQRKQIKNCKFVDNLRALPKIPRDHGMRPNNGGVPLTKGRGLQNSAPSSLTWGGGSRTKTKDGASVIKRVTREAKEMSQRSRLITPTGMLSGRLGQVKKAPVGMAQEYKIANQPALKILTRHKSSRRISGGVSAPSLEDCEQRLRAAQVSNKKRDSSAPRETLAGSPPSSPSSYDETFVDEADDLFAEKEEPKPAPKSTRPPPARRIIKPVAPSTRVASSSPPMKAKPSDVISSMIQKSQRSLSPASHAGSVASATPKPMMPARRRPADVDIFNRGTKKPRR